MASMSRLLPLAARTPNAAPAVSTKPSSHGARHESELVRRLALVFARIAPRLAGISRMVARASFEAMFPGVPWSDEGNDAGRGTALIDAYVADGSVAYGGHSAGFKSRIAEEGKSLPSKTFDLFGHSPNCAHALAGLARLAREGKSLPVVAFFRSRNVGASEDSPGDFTTMRVLAWCGFDLPTEVAAAMVKVAREGAPTIKGVKWGTFCGIPECPPNMPSVGRGGYPGVTVYVTHPDSDPVKGRGYRVLRIALKDRTFDLTSGEEGIARWLVSDGFPTRARKR